MPLRETKKEQRMYRKKLKTVLMEVRSMGEGMSLGSQTIQFLCSLKLKPTGVSGSLEVNLHLEVFSRCSLFWWL